MKINKLLVSGAIAIVLSLSSAAVLAGMQICGKNLPAPIYVECAGTQFGAAYDIPKGDGCVSFTGSTDISWSLVSILGTSFQCKLYSSADYTSTSKVAVFNVNINGYLFSASEGQISGYAVNLSYNPIINPYNTMSGEVKTTLNWAPTTKGKTK
jgi:hypothetical protein